MAVDTVVGLKLQMDGSEAVQSLKSVKTQIREAQQDVIRLSEKFGATSTQAREAAKRMAELKDRLADAKTLSDSFNPDKKFMALSQSLNGVLGGFSALTGAMGLLGVESENVQKQLLKVQSAMALSQGLNQVGESIQSFKNFGKTIVDTLGKSGAIGLGIAGVTALGLAMAGVFTKRQSEDAKAYKATLKDFTAAAADATKNVNEVKNSFELARNGVISKEKALKVYNETLGDALGKTNDINEAERRLAQNAEAYVKITGWKAQANAMLTISAQKSADMIVQTMKLEKLQGTSFYDEAKKVLDRGKEEIAAIEKRANEMMLGIQIFSSKYGLGNADKTETKTDTKGSIGKSQEQINAEATEKFLKEFQQRKRDEAAEQAVIDAEAKAMQREKDFEDARNLQTGLTLIENEGLQERLKNSVDNAKVRLATEQQRSDAEIALAEREAQAKMLTAQLVANTTAIFADLVGKETAAGKVLAIASATINTYLAATQALKADYSMYGPAAQFARVAAVVSTIALGLKQVREIVKVKVPGAAAGAGSASMSAGASVSAPLQATSPQSTRTRLEQDQLNQIGNAAVRAFVVESDVSNSQERIRRLNRAARI